MASVGDKEKRDAANRIMTIAIIFAGLLLTKYAAMTEFSTLPGTTSIIWHCLLLSVLFLSQT